MKKTVFSMIELEEMKSLEVYGGVSPLMVSQMECVNDADGCANSLLHQSGCINAAENCACGTGSFLPQSRCNVQSMCPIVGGDCYGVNP
ncbi:MAG: hypothetical protein HFJ91_07110 [Muribaculaceae bacterium]|nr:hypothetical protein [Muribaculaceae bacterium]